MRYNEWETQLENSTVYRPHKCSFVSAACKRQHWPSQNMHKEACEFCHEHLLLCTSTSQRHCRKKVLVNKLPAARLKGSAYCCHATIHSCDTKWISQGRACSRNFAVKSPYWREFLLKLTHLFQDRIVHCLITVSHHVMTAEYFSDSLLTRSTRVRWTSPHSLSDLFSHHWETHCRALVLTDTTSPFLLLSS